MEAGRGRPEQAGPAELRDDPELLVRLQTAVDEANKTVSRAESIRRFRVLPVDLTEQNGYLTPTLKIKRALIHQDFAAEIEELYRSAPDAKTGRPAAPRARDRRWTGWWRPRRHPATGWSTPPARCASW